MRQSTLLALRATFLSLAFCAAAWGQLPSLAASELNQSEANCRKIAQLTVHEYSIISAVFVDATDRAPAYCRVVGVLPPEIVFQVVLPAAWNGRILMNGNGGYAGDRPYAPGRLRAVETLVSDGYVSVRTNTGHDNRAEPLATFALNNRQKEIDYSFRAVRLTIQTTKELTEMYYGRPANYTYWQGCSTGGRQGLMAAQRFPEDFDGIIVGAPVLDFTNTQIWGGLECQGSGRDANQPGEGRSVGPGDLQPLRQHRRSRGRPSRRPQGVRLRSRARPSPLRRRVRRRLLHRRGSDDSPKDLRGCGQSRRDPVSRASVWFRSHFGDRAAAEEWLERLDHPAGRALSAAGVCRDVLALHGVRAGRSGLRLALVRL